jgi:hypothetical protein
VSDVAHSVTNAFHRFHARLNTDHTNRFVQLHGRNIAGKHVTANDGRHHANNPATVSMANNFKTEISGQSIAGLTAVSCQDGSATMFCGETNVQGRLTTHGQPAPQNNTCLPAGMDGTRFLHLEQGRGFLTAASMPAQNSWPEIAAALRPITHCVQALDCNVVLPAQQSSISTLACP